MSKPKIRRDLSSRPPTVFPKTVIESATPAEVNLAMVQDRLLEVLRRETSNLMAESSEGALGRDRSMALIGYLKFLNQIEDKQAETLAELSDEELKKQSED